MSAARSEEPGRPVARLLSGGLGLAGMALIGYGGSVHLSVSAAVGSGRCDGCAPWHPLFVVAPIVVGAALLTVAGFLLARR